MATAKRLPSGSWSVNVYIGKDKDGKRKYKRFTGTDKRKVEREAAAYADEHRGEVSTDTFGYAARQYIEMKRNVLSPTTVCGYNRILKNYLKDWDNIPIYNISAKFIQEFVNDSVRTLSPKTVHNIYGFITAVLYSVNSAIRLNITLPPLVKHFKELPSPDAVIQAVRGSRCELAAMLSMWMSLRMSEIRGLRYHDISGNILTIQNVLVTGEGGDVLKNRTKTYGSARRLVIPDYIMRLIPASEDAEAFVVPLSHSQIYKTFQAALKAAGLPPMPFHDLRHMNASIMLSLGIPDKYAMERGGWSSTSVLKSVYQNTFSAVRQAADHKIDDYFNSIIRCSEKSVQHENATRQDNIG